MKISAALETPDLLLSSWFSGTPVMRTQKGNKKQFEQGFKLSGQLNIQGTILIVDSLLIFQHSTLQYRANKTHLLKNCIVSLLFFLWQLKPPPSGITQDRKMTLKYVNGLLDSLKSNCCCVSFGYFINLYIYYMAKKPNEMTVVSYTNRIQVSRKFELPKLKWLNSGVKFKGNRTYTCSLI